MEETIAAHLARIEQAVMQAGGYVAMLRKLGAIKHPAAAEAEQHENALGDALAAVQAIKQHLDTPAPGA